MTKNKLLVTKAIILNRQNYGEADRILQLITPDGRLSAIAKGVRRQRSKLAGGSQLFAVNDMTLMSGRGEMLTLTSSRINEFFENILKDYERMQLAYRLIELTYRNSSTAESEQWYEILKESLTALNDVTMSPILTEIWFYIRFSELLGYEMSLYYDGNGEKLAQDKTYIYDSVEKSLTVSTGGALTANHIKLMRLLANYPIKKVATLSGVEQLLSECLLTVRAHAAV